MERMPGDLIGDAHRRQGVEDQYTEMVIAALLEEGHNDLLEILHARVDLQRFVNDGTLQHAKSGIQNLGRTLQKYPRLLEQLAAATRAKPESVVMAVLPFENLVFTQTAEGVRGFAPVLTCTHNAMGGIRSRMDPRHPYAIVASDNGLIPYLLGRLEQEDSPIISYDSRRMNPEDYIALGAQGIFANETFRFAIVDGRITR